LKGEKSEAMLLAGSCSSPSDANVKIVKLLDPPGTSAPGDRVYLASAAAAPTSAPDRCNDKHWEAITAELKTKGGKAQYKGIDLVTAQGPVTVDAALIDGSEIH